MKKKSVIMAVAVMTAGLLAGCGNELSNEYVTVKQYKGLEVPAVKGSQDTDTALEQAIQANLEGTAETVPITDRAAEMGDWVNIDYTGYTDGEAFENGSAEGWDLELGSGSFLAANGDYKGFEEQIAGHETGDEFDITVQFPEDYRSTEMAGKVAEFHIVLNEIYEENVPELTDEWVQANSDTAKTVDEYKDELRSQIEENANSQTQSQLTDYVQEALIDNIEIKKYPEEAVAEQEEEIKAYYTQIAEFYGATLEELITSEFQTTEEEFNDWIEDSAKQTVIFDEAVKLIAKKQKLELSGKEYEEKIAEYAEDYGISADEYKEQMGEKTLRNTILRETVTDYLVQECVQVDQSSAE